MLLRRSLMKMGLSWLNKLMEPKIAEKAMFMAMKKMHPLMF